MTINGFPYEILEYKQVLRTVKRKMCRHPLISRTYLLKRKRRKRIFPDYVRLHAIMIFIYKDHHYIQTTLYLNHHSNYQFSDGETCTTNAQPCNGFPHSICTQGQCICQKGYYHSNDLCMAGLCFYFPLNLII